MSSTRPDDRTTQARIRDAAIARVAENGLASLTARGVAEDAGVSPGSVMHHFGSMEELRAACDEYVVGAVRMYKTIAAEEGVAVDPMNALKRQAEGPPVAKYFSQVLIESSPRVDALVDELVEDAAVYSEKMVESGLMKPTNNPKGRATILVLWSMGNLVLSSHMERLTGVDITTEPADPHDAAPYMGPMLEIMHQGIMTDASLELMKGAFVGDEGETEDGKE